MDALADPLDDIVQRLSPFLQRNAPVDVLDLYPGPGLLSSKINQLLNPRRHVFFEPEFKHYEPILGPLIESRSCNELVSRPPPALDAWGDLLNKHFPEQGPSNTDSSGELPINDTLLVLAHVPPAVSTKDHFSGDKWLTLFMNQALNQTGLHRYGSVRLLALAQPSSLASIFPRNINGRSRQSLSVEQVARHAFEVAAVPTGDRQNHAYLRQWESVSAAAKRTEQRTQEGNVVVPAGREFPPMRMALDSARFGVQQKVPFEPRAQTEQHEKYTLFLEQEKRNSAKDKAIEKERVRVRAKLSADDQHVHRRMLIASKMGQADEINKSIARVAADPKSTYAALEPMAQEAENLSAAFEEAILNSHYDTTRTIPQFVDDRRFSLHTGNIDDSLYVHDRRPFEPLLVHTDELYPRNEPQTWIYFEADPNAAVARRLNRLDKEKREIATIFISVLSSSFKPKQHLTVHKLFELVFPPRSANDMVKAVPGLAKFAFKAPKPNFDELPKTLHYNQDDIPSGQEPDPVNCYQENLNYDVSRIHCRILPVSTLWDIAIEYAHQDTVHSPLQLRRILGATVTRAQDRVFDDKMTRKW